MADKKTERRTVEDLDRALKSLATHFGEDAFVIIGSQAALVDWPSTPDEMRNTPEIDIYLAREKSWAERNAPALPDFEIEGLFGQRSPFHQKYGFFIDGVSPDTAPLPDGWETRAVFREILHEGKTITAIAPCIEDLVVSKLKRLETKDREFIEGCIRTRGLDLERVRDGLFRAPFDVHHRERALRYLSGLPAKKPMQFDPIEPPEHPQDGSHKPFWKNGGLQVFIRELDEQSGLYIRNSNPLGPAFKSRSAESYFMHGEKMSKSRWEEHPEVIAHRSSAPKF